MDFQYSPQINQQLFQFFSNGLSNQDIRRQFPQIKSDSLERIIEVSVELVIGEIQNIYTTKFSCQKDEEYDKRRQQVIEQISSSRRFIFSGPNANKLGQNSINHFLRICKHYMRYGNLNNYDYKIIHKLFKNWFNPSKNTNEIYTSSNANHSELAKKKRTMQKLKIQHDILIKKSHILTLQEEIQALEEALKQKDKPCKIQQEQAQEQIQQAIQTNRGKFSKIAALNAPQETLPQPLVKQQPKQSNFQGHKQEQKGRQQLKWKRQQEEFLISLLQKYTIRDQGILLSQLQQRFGQQKFTPYTLRDKKYQMLRIARERCLLAIRNKSYFSQEQFKSFANHFMTIDNIQAFRFISKFLHKYYFCNFQSLSLFALKEIINEVLQQETKVLSRGNTSSIIKQLMPKSKTSKKQYAKDKQIKNQNKSILRIAKRIKS